MKVTAQVIAGDEPKGPIIDGRKVTIDISAVKAFNVKPKLAAGAAIEVLMEQLEEMGLDSTTYDYVVRFEA
jgi:hypothetical protein